MNPVFAGLPTTIFEAMSRLARETGAVNLGQGFPDDAGPADVRQKGGRGGARRLEPVSADDGPARAAPGRRRRITGASRASTSIPEREVMVTSGATEAIAGALMALIEPGDEVVLFQPLYDAYLPLVRRAGGVPRFVRLAPPDWRLTEEALERGLHAEDPRRRSSTTR